MWRIYFSQFWVPKSHQSYQTWGGKHHVCTNIFKLKAVLLLSSSTICSEPSLKPRDSSKPTRQNLPTMQGNHHTGSVWEMWAIHFKKKANVWNNIVEFKQSLFQNLQRSCYTRRWHPQRKTAKIKRVFKKIMISILSLYKCEHT